ncbi:MAG TPA: serine/threonine-protein kinase [Nannocystaceae bacterium]|nr:serine/threonine-protein kinase [Nannocystaceae bacterium]
MAWDADTPDSVDSFLRDVAAAPDVDPEAFSAAKLAPGAMLTDRIRIVRRIGAGGMGVVWLADHLELDRPIAVKLHPYDDARGPDRLLREARAVAAINHPNVIVIHDVGRLAAGLVFVAMEYVDGGTLRSWAREEPRAWPDVLELFLQALRGLAAAHAVGLVHGDVKPDNLLVGRDGRVRVADFGLARFATRDPTPDEDIDASDVRDGGSAVGMGTPAYMAPEQLAGAPATAASDQYALCVSLWEVLFGARPFAAASTRKLPTRLRAVLDRGLAVDPRDRYPDMSTLQHALERCRRPGIAALRVIAATAGAPLALAVAIAVANDHDVCANAATRAEQVLPTSRRAEVILALRENAEDPNAMTEVDRQLVLWGERWGELAASSCRELHDEEIDAEIFARREACLESRRRRFDALVEVLAAPDSDLASRATAAVMELPAPEVCDEATDSEWIELTPDVDRVVQRAVVLQNLSRYEQALQELRPLLARSDLAASDRTSVLGQLASTAEAQGDYVAAARDYGEAFATARAAADDYRAIQIGLHVVHLYAADLERLDEAESWWRQTEALAPGVYLDAGRRGELVSIHASLLDRQGRHREAEEEFARAIDIFEDGHTRGESYGLGFALAGRARALDDVGDDDEAMRAYERALHYQERDPRTGPVHGANAAILNNMAACAYDLRRYEESVVYYRRAIDMATALLGPKHPHTATFLGNLANSLMELDREDEAYAAMQSSNAILRERLGEHMAVALSEYDFSLLLRRIARYDDARLHALDAVELFRRLEGEAPNLALALASLARTEHVRGDDVAARRALDESIAIWTAIAERDHESEQAIQELDELRVLFAELAY